MRLLIVTQAVDTQDRALGFFHRWLEEFAPRFERVEVVCLKEGQHDLPKNVFVHSLGKESGRSLWKYVSNFYKFIFSLRYDAVLVHMNEEYVLLGGVFWYLMGKRLVLWRNHKMGSWRTKLAVFLSSVVCHTSPEAFVARSEKAVQMPIGIDTELFVPPQKPNNSILFLGRLDVVKRVEIFLGALARLESGFKARLYGSPTEPNSPYAAAIRAQASPLIARKVLELHGGVAHEATAALYRAHGIYCNLTPSGSFDKTIGEAMASGCIVVCANEALRGVLPDELIAREAPEAAAALQYALELPAAQAKALRTRSRSYVEREHSLKLLTERLHSLLMT